MILFCTGDVNPEKVLEITDQLISPELQDLGTITRYFPEEPESVFQKEKRQTMSVAQPLFYVGIKGKPEEDLFRQELLYSVVLEAVLGKSSALYQELYSKGLITPSFATEVSCERNYAHLIMGGSAPNPEETAKAITKGLESIRENGLSQEDFSRAKKVVLGDMIRIFNSVEQIANNFINTLFRGASLFDAPTILDEMTIEDCNEVMNQLFREEKTVLSIVSQ